jgi:hypothetical protein
MAIAIHDSRSLPQILVQRTVGKGNHWQIKYTEARAHGGDRPWSVHS